MDFTLQQRLTQDDYLGKLLNVCCLQNKMFDQLIFDFKYDNDESSVSCFDQTQLVEGSLSTWKFQLSSLEKELSSGVAADDCSEALISVVVNVLNISVCLLEPVASELDDQLNKHKLAKTNRSTLDMMQDLELETSPIWMKQSLELLTLVSFKLMFHSSDNIQLFDDCLQKLLPLASYDSTCKITESISEFQSNFKLSNCINSYIDANGFKNGLMDGMLNDLKKFNKQLLNPRVSDLSEFTISAERMAALTEISSKFESMATSSEHPKRSKLQLHQLQ
ncbi:unnamed protein product [Ambrosiozyma monospora]|uniref:Unnamed protein product n=1 Tax=Ambrosiozyma monospora TaxID=43982 RepID=A0ACB5TRC3_AMBMO|nr:unnamed protein product [Ambrosiozyma monospora]